MSTRKRSSRLTFLVLFGLLTGASIVEANLLTNGSFEAVPVTGSDTCDGFFFFCIRSFSSTPGWTQFGDGVDLIHDNYFQPATVLVDPSDGVQFLDMNQATTAGLGGIEQIVSATQGAVYRLDLDTTAWAQNSIGGTLGYELYDPSTTMILASGSFTDNVGGTWVTRTLQATAISSQIGVRIQGLAATEAGMGLDNVRLNQVPAPSTTLLLSMGLVALLGYRWPRRGHNVRS
jgi:hypothetical protein